MSDDVMPALEQCGFVRVPTDGPPELWMTCDSCAKSDHFWLTDTEIRCRCGAVYSHALRPDGEQMPVGTLTFVPFNKGPMDLADTEWDPVRLAMVILLTLGVVAIAVSAVVWFVYA